MKLTDFGDKPDNTWFRNILEWSRKKISLDDNLDCVTMSVEIATTETKIGHSLGRVPKGVIPLLQFPGATIEMTMTNAPTNNLLFISARVKGTYGLLIF